MASKTAPSDTTTITLHKREAGDYFGHPGICTVTFCRGDPQAALADLRAKALPVLQANPWIGGRFVKKALVFASTCTEDDVNEIVTICKNAAVHRNQPYPMLVGAVAKNHALSVSKGKAIQKSRQRVTKLVVVEPATLGDEFSSVFSM
jgi:hypothetical protein